MFFLSSLLGKKAPSYDELFRQGDSPFQAALERVTAIAEGAEFVDLVQAQEDVLYLSRAAFLLQSSPLRDILIAANVRIAGDDLLPWEDFDSQQARRGELFSQVMAQSLERLILLPIRKEGKTYYARYQVNALFDKIDPFFSQLEQKLSERRQ